MTSTEILEAIQAATPDDKVLLLSLLTYNELPVTADLLDNDVPAWGNIKGAISVIPFVYNLPLGSETPIIINMVDSTIKIGPADPVTIGTDLTKYQANPTFVFDEIDASDDTITSPANMSVLAKQWADNTYTSLVSITLLPDTDTGVSGGLTLDNINIIIKP